MVTDKPHCTHPEQIKASDPVLTIPSQCPRRGLKREEAALYVGLGATKFMALVEDGRMPRPKRIDGRVVWDIRSLDLAFDSLPDESSAPVNSWAHLDGDD